MSEAQVLFGIGVLLSIIGSLIVVVLGGIKSEIRDVNDKLERIETDLHNRVTDVERRQQNSLVEIDRRVSKIEARCELHVKEL